MADARSYIASTFGGVDMGDVPSVTIRETVDKLFPGGWVAYERDFMRFRRPAAEPANSPHNLRVTAAALIGKRVLGEYDEVHAFEVTDTTRKLVVSIAIVDRKTRRDIVTARRLQLWTWTRSNPDEAWSKPDKVEMEEAVNEHHIRYGVVNTPDRAASAAEQFETCYRPGSSKAPMAGWIARAQLSWEQAYADDRPKVDNK